MATELASLMGKIKLTENEERIIDLSASEPPNPQTTTNFCLVGKILSHKPLNLKRMAHTFLIAWHVKECQLKEIGNGLFLCEFALQKDKERVLIDGPWHYEKQLVILKEITGDEQPSELNFDTCPFWVRILDLPLNKRDPESILKVATSIGEVIELDPEGLNSWTCYVRVRVLVNITGPLPRGTRISTKKRLKDESTKELPIWVDFKYEKLPNYCYWCGLFGHVIVECLETPAKLDDLEWPYDPSLRATPGKMQSVKIDAAATKKIKESSAGDKPVYRKLFPASPCQNPNPTINDSPQNEEAGPQTKLFNTEDTNLEWVDSINSDKKKQTPKYINTGLHSKNNIFNVNEPIIDQTSASPHAPQFTIGPSSQPVELFPKPDYLLPPFSQKLDRVNQALDLPNAMHITHAIPDPISEPLPYTGSITPPIASNQPTGTIGRSRGRPRIQGKGQRSSCEQDGTKKRSEDSSLTGGKRKAVETEPLALKDDALHPLSKKVCEDIDGVAIPMSAEAASQPRHFP